jgi:transketolase
MLPKIEQFPFGDLGFSVVEPFTKEFPDRFLNAGVAEQNMIGMATGWSLAENKIVFVYSIANFSTLRCLEQIRTVTITSRFQNL